MSSSNNPSENPTPTETNAQDTVFILKSSMTTLSRCEVYLKKKGWFIQSTTDIMKALAIIVESRPRFVLIDINHPNPKVKTLPRLIKQTFQISPIVFLEGMDIQSLNTLKALKLEYSIFPPVSGPAIERMLNRLANLNSQSATSSSDVKTFSKNSSSSSANMMISIKGEKKEGAKAEDIEKAQNLLRQLGDAAITESVNQGKFTALINNEDSKGLGINLEEVEAEEKSAASSSSQGSQKSYQSQKDPKLKQNSTAQSALQSDMRDAELEKNADALKSAIAESNNSRKNLNPQNNSSTFNTKPPISPLDLNPSDMRESAEKPNKPDLGGIGSIEPAYKASANLEHVKTHRRDGSALSDSSIIVKAVRHALGESILPIPSVTKEKIETSAQLACLSVNSLQFSGYILAAYGNNRALSTELMETFRMSVVRFLNNHGEDILIRPGTNIKVSQLPFLDWTMKNTEFVMHSLHRGSEIAMSFLNCNIEEPKVVPEPHRSMIGFDIKEICADKPVEFDVYIDMPKNNRCIKLKRTGDIFHGEQKKRLQERGIEKLLMKENSWTDFLRYHAQNNIDQLISQTATSQKQPA